MKLTELISKPVLNLCSGKIEGIIKSVIFDNSLKKLKYFKIFDNNEEDCDKVLNTNFIYKVGQDAIIIKNENCISLEEASIKNYYLNSPINAEIYNNLGTKIGNLLDLILDEKFNVKNLITNNMEIDVSRLISISPKSIIILDENSNIKISSLKRKPQKTLNIDKIKASNSQRVYILNESSQNTSKETQITSQQPDIEETNSQIIQENITVKTPIKKDYSQSNKTPTLLTANYQFLIGRKLEKNIYTQNKEIIAKKNSKITDETIKKARLYYKIRELPKFSR